MIEKLIVVSFAAFIGWEILRSVTFVQLSARLAPVIVILTAYCLSFLPARMLLAFASAGGVALLIKFIEPDGMMPLRYSMRFLREARQAWEDRRSSKIPPL